MCLREHKETERSPFGSMGSCCRLNDYRLFHKRYVGIFTFTKPQIWCYFFFQRVGQRNGCFTLERLISKIIIILCSSGCFRNGAKQQVHCSYQVSGKLYLSSFLLH